MQKDLKIRMSGRIYYAVILIFAVLVSMVLNLVPAVLGPLIPLVWGAAIFICAVIYIYVRSHFIEFGEEEIHARVGLLNTKSLYAPYKNVDNVSVHAKLTERVVGLCEIRVDTTGRAETEIIMRHIPASQAQQAVAIIKEKRAGLGKSGAVPAQDSEPEKPKDKKKKQRF